MHNILAESVEIGAIQQYVNAPMAVALIFALAGAFFIGILVLRRRKK